MAYIDACQVNIYMKLLILEHSYIHYKHDATYQL